MSDYIPMHYNQGDWIELQFSDDGEPTGHFPVELVQVEPSRALAKSKVGQYYLLDAKTEKISKLTDKDRCVDCGEFFCQCNQENKMTKHDVSPVPFSKLDELGNDDVIEQVEGVLKTLYEPRKEGKYERQNGVLVNDDGDEHRIAFAMEKVFQDQDKKGKRVRITCSFSRRDPTGVKMKVNRGNGQTYRKIWVTSTADIEWIQDGKTEGQRGSGGGGGYKRSGSGINVKVEVNKYFGVLTLVNKGYEYYLEQGHVPEMTSSDLKDITTHLCIRGEREGGLIFPSAENGESQSTEEDEPKRESSNNFRTIKNPKTGKTLDGVSEAKLIQLLAWAHSYTGDDKDWRRFQAAVVAVADEEGVTSKQAFEMKLDKEEDPGPSKESLDGFSMKVYGVDYDELEEDDFAKILGDYKAALKEIAKFDQSSDDDEDLPE